ncbi:glutamyl-tRNA reductase [Sedimentibacter acidaminivorans]|uniref:Glutamyl-tRNA reductase n=1 Tax=Sedimentibacter acidaminivorans TaxID=913099 RepID=A0ABS4GEU9_9FIRM|nr:glutamyl-tRNA reductase [Sedimentibacter acidaminivorans]MBP1926162.1 glutamyl-tRNA reductase [Sedimentibacter acidaminivorans]
MDVAVIGINHNIAPIGIREKVSFSESKKVEATAILLESGIKEVLILSTCNRSEIYVASLDISNAINVVKDFYINFFGDRSVQGYIFDKKGNNALIHIYEVCCGFDSIVIGEDQILGQVKDALSTAIELKGSSKILNKLFREAITVSKKIKTETKLSENPLSISYIGVKRIKEEICDLSDKKVLLVGLGKMGVLALTHLREYEIGKIYVSNRNLLKSIEISEEIDNIEVVKYENLKNAINIVDIVICATSSPHIIIKQEDIGFNRKKPVYILDLALPRDVEEDVKNLENVLLYDVDSLKSESEENQRLRKTLMEKSRYTINESIVEFNKWKKSIGVDSVLESINNKCQNIKNDSLSYIYRKVSLNHRDKKIIEKMVESSMRKLLREAILNLKEIEEEEKLEGYVKVLQELFELK